MYGNSQKTCVWLMLLSRLFAEEEREAQREEVVCSKSHSWHRVKLRCQPRSGSHSSPLLYPSPSPNPFSSMASEALDTLEKSFPISICPWNLPLLFMHSALGSLLWGGGNSYFVGLDMTLG